MDTKIKIGEREVGLKLSSKAVETIEEFYDKPMDDVFVDMKSVRAKQVNFMLWAMLEEPMDIEEMKIGMAKNYTYNQCLELLTEVFASPNEKAAVIDTEPLSLVPPQDIDSTPKSSLS